MVQCMHMVRREPRHLVECVPNFSEGRRPTVMDQIQDAVAGVAGVALLDRHVDPIHNRMVLTFAGPSGPVAEAAFRGASVAARLIDLSHHEGVHPRIGALDVLPFVPLGSTPMAHCVELARRVGWRISAELDTPVYLYARAATRPEREWLPTIRGAGYEWLRARVGEDPALSPDFGPARLGPAGATAVGARGFLVAYNVTLATGDLALANAVARAIRASSGGLPGVQARAFPTVDPEIVQVSVNVLDIEQTPLHVVFEHIEQHARQIGVSVVESELVGLLPTRALIDTVRHALRFAQLPPSSALEIRLLETMLAGESTESSA